MSRWRFRDLPRVSAVAVRYTARWVLLSLLCGISGANAGSPAQGGLGLVIGNRNYESLPPLVACRASAHIVAAALRKRNYDVVEQLDATNGQMEAAIINFAKRRADKPDAPGLVYYCGYVSSLEGRVFVLPTPANITRTTDLLVQGVVAASLLDALSESRGGALAGGGLAVLDVFATPPNPAPRDFDALATRLNHARDGYLAAIESGTSEAPSAVAQGLEDALAAPTVKLQETLVRLRDDLAGARGVALAALAQPTSSVYLAGAPAPTAPPTPSSPKAPAPQPPAEAATSPPATQAPSPSLPPLANPPPAATNALPDEAQMSDVDRRRVQSALARLGYYDSIVDGVFGPETRAAIRRFQHEIGDQMTGRLNSDEATRLVNGSG
jgi:hypothetical protein